MQLTVTECKVIFQDLRRAFVHTAVKGGARAHFPPKLSLYKVLNFDKFLLSSPKLNSVAEKLSFILYAYDKKIYQ